MHGQCTRQIRKYADFQGKYETVLYALGLPVLYGSVTNDNYATDNNPATASTLNMPLTALGLASVTQFLQFTSNGTTAQSIATGTPVTVKFTVPTSLLGVLNSIEIGTFSGLHTVAQQTAFIGLGNNAGYDATTKTQYYTGTTVVDALNAAGEVELTFTPAEIYNGVYVKLNAPLVSLALSTNVFHAYIMQDATGNIGCDDRIDVLSGVKGNVLANLASATGSVTNPWNAVDNDPTYTTYALMSTGVQVLSNVFETVIFQTPSVAGDSVSIVVQNPGGGLLDLSLLTGFTIQPYLGNTTAGPAITNNPTFLSLRLLPGSADKYIVTAAVNTPFDRIEITMGGVASALANLRIYDISRIRHVPATSTLTVNGIPATGPLCLNQTAGLQFSVTNNESCAIYTWYDAGNNQLTTGVSNGGLSYAPTITTAGTYEYYVKASRQGCTNSTAQTPVAITVLSLPDVPVIPPVIVCIDQAATLTISNAATGVQYAWYSTALGTTALSNTVTNGISYTTGIPAAAIYYAEATNTSTGCTSSSRGTGNVTVTPKPGMPTLSILPHP
ncbi:Muc19 precursor [Filimonas lacunae]|nr:Muc19 precursor [Filimonas lacunae]